MKEKKFLRIFLLIGILSLLVSCALVSKEKLFWLDELITYYLVSDNSIFHMLNSIADQVDSSPPFYHILLYYWSHIFGKSELVLRLFSSLMMTLSFYLLLSILIRVRGFYESIIGLTIIFFLDRIIFYFNSEARYYALFLCEFVILIYLYIKILFYGKRYYILITLLQIVFLLTHPFGIVYSATILISILIYNFLHRESLDYKLLFFTLLGWAVSFLYLPIFLNQIKVGYPHFWIEKPSLWIGIRIFSIDLFITPGWIDSLISFIILIIFLLTVYKRYFMKKNYHCGKCMRQKIFFNILALILILLPIANFIYSNIFEPMFEKRYMIISELGWGLMIVGILDENRKFFRKLFKIYRNKYLLQISLIALVFIMIINSLVFRDLQRNEIEKDIKCTHKDEYFILLSAYKYLPRYFYSQNKSAYLFVLDEEVSSMPNNVKNALVDYKLMQALKRNYPFHNIVTSSYIIDSLKTFKVRNESNRLWFEVRIINNPNFEFVKIYSDVFMVKRKKLNE